MDGTSTLTGQKLLVAFLDRGNIRDHISFRQVSRPSSRSGGVERVDEASGVIEAVRVYPSMQGTAVTVDGQVHHLRWTSRVELRRATGRPPMVVPAPVRPGARAAAEPADDDQAIPLLAPGAILDLYADGVDVSLIGNRLRLPSEPASSTARWKQ